jgi:membrane associated rhomboid family serine protease
VTPWVKRLLIANVVMFFLQQTVPGVYAAQVLVPAEILLRPWTIVTYMFLHGGIMHLLFNMLALYFMGPRVEQRLGSNRFLTLYFISGISGALLSFAFARNSAIIGASGAIFGVMLAFARFWPRDQFLIWGIIPVEARWLVVGYTVLSLLGAGGIGGAGVAHFAHLGGFVGAFLYLSVLEHNAGAKKFKRAATAAPPVIDSAVKNWRNVDRAGIHAVNRDEVNRILDKISATGLGSLTTQERVFLSNFVPPDDRKPVS